jgi:acyl carrier protein
MHADSSPLPAADDAAQSPAERELAELIVTSLNLETAAAEIEPEAPLYGDGLGLDSIDILEMSLAISKAYGVQLRSDDPDNGRIFRSLRSLNEHVQARRTK